MKLFSKPTLILFLVIYLVMFAGENAFAYIDPATGSYLFQLLVAGLLGGLYAVKVYWKSLKGFMNNLFRKNKSASDEPSE